jgi:RHS repeat-associated protein
MLGSSRVITTNTGVLCYDADFTPFGFERIVANSCTQNKYKFEGKERDDEMGNDEFGARYYSNRFGRWLSADWSSVPVPVPYANLTNPQTLNLYAMVADDPESFADLDGHGQACYVTDGGATYRAVPCGSLTAGAEQDALQAHGGDANTTNNAQQTAAEQQAKEELNRQLLINAQNSALSNPAFQATDVKGQYHADGTPVQTTWCNAATLSVLKGTASPTAGLTGKDGNALGAHEMIQAIRNSKDYHVVSAKEVQELANKGKVVIPTLDGTRAHLATVRPGVPGENPLGHGPRVANVGPSKTSGIGTVSRTFNKDLSKIVYYTSN